MPRTTTSKTFVNHVLDIIDSPSGSTDHDYENSSTTPAEAIVLNKRPFCLCIIRIPTFLETSNWIDLALFVERSEHFQ